MKRITPLEVRAADCASRSVYLDFNHVCFEDATR